MCALFVTEGVRGVLVRLYTLDYMYYMLLFPHSLKVECEKMVQEKSEMQRHYVMVSDS